MFLEAVQGQLASKPFPRTAVSGKERGKWAPDKNILAKARVGGVFHRTQEYQGYQRQGRREAGAGYRFQTSSRGHSEAGTGFISIAALNRK